MRDALLGSLPDSASGAETSPTAPAPDAPAAVETGAADPEPPVSSESSDPSSSVPAEPAQPRPQPGLSGVVEGVVTGRLPRIGDDAADASPEPAPDSAARAADLSLPAWQRFARRAEAPAGRPLFAVILIDAGMADADRAALAALPLPVTLALDPTAPGAPGIAADWRAAGQELLLLGSGLPSRGDVGDMEVALEALGAGFPEMIGLLDAPVGGVQGNRAAMTALAPGLADRGLALVTWDRGLNPADQIARDAGTVAARVFRELDADGENAATIQRYLDRAVFRAAQEGSVVVTGRLRPETVQALLDWAGSPRAATVAPVPVSAVLARR